MRSLKFVAVAAILMVFRIAAVDAAPSFPPGAEAREARLNAKSSPQTRAWLKQEAARAMASNTVSEAAVSKAVRSDKSRLDLSGMSVEDAVFMIMMMISRDARDDMRQMLSGMEKTRSKKGAKREAGEKPTAANPAVKNQIPLKSHPQQARPIIPRSQALDGFLAGRRVSYDSLGDLSQEQQQNMKKVLDRFAKSESAISKAMKKGSNTEAGIIQNIK